MHSTTSTDKISAIIIDDDLPSVEVLRNALAVYPDVETAGTATDMEQGYRLIKEHRPDILFLDIELNDANGLELLERLDREESARGMKTVFYTSYSKYLIQAIRFQAFDFILKPFDAEDLNLILNRYRLDRSNRKDEGEPRPMVKRIAPCCPEERNLSITTVTNDKIILSPSDILYFKYDSHSRLWEVVLNTLRHFILKRHTTAEVILSISPSLVRTHKSFILNISYLARITASECVLLPPYDDITELKISKAYKRQLMERFLEL